MEGNIIHTLTSNLDKIGHIHIAGVPGRHDPFTGELNYINILRELKALQFKGVVGLEFYPIEEPVIDLTKFRECMIYWGLF